jgi:hypothetical protein
VLARVAGSLCKFICWPCCDRDWPCKRHWTLMHRDSEVSQWRCRYYKRDRAGCVSILFWLTVLNILYGTVLCGRKFQTLKYRNEGIFYILKLYKDYSCQSWYFFRVRTSFGVFRCPFWVLEFY